MATNTGTKRPIATLEDALRIIEDLRKENKDLRHKVRMLGETISDLTRGRSTHQQ